MPTFYDPIPNLVKTRGKTRSYMPPLPFALNTLRIVYSAPRPLT